VSEGAVDNFLPLRPFPLTADQKIFGSRPRPNGFLQILWLLANPSMAHGMDSKEAHNSLCWVGRITNQVSGLLANPISGSPPQPVR